MPQVLFRSLCALSLLTVGLYGPIAQAQVRLVVSSPRGDTREIQIAADRGSTDAARSIAYFNHSSDRVVQVRVAEPVLCADFSSTSTARVRMRLIDPNEQIQPNRELASFGGIIDVSGSNGGFRMVNGVGSARTLRVVGSADLVCYVPGTPPPSAPAGTPVGQIASKELRCPDCLFANGFEAAASVGVDLAVSIGTPASVPANGTLNYSITFSNVGSSGTSNAQARDFFPQPSSRPSGCGTGSQPPCPATLGSGSWTCTSTGGATCPAPASGSGGLNLAGLSFPVGSSLTFTISRPLSQQVPLPPEGTQFQVSAAVFSEPGANEAVQSNNVAQRTISIVNNQPPTIGPIGPQSTLENEAKCVYFTASDPEGATLQYSGTSSNAVLVGTPLPASAFNDSRCTASQPNVRLEPALHRYGVTTITLLANDGVQNSAPQSFQLTVTNVNQAPSIAGFVAGAANCVHSKGEPINFNPNANPPTFEFPAGATGTITCNDFLNINFGPFEDDQVLVPNGSTPPPVQIVSQSGPAVIVGSPALARTSDGRSANLSFTLAQPSVSGSRDITLRVRDNGGTANGGVDLSDPRTFRIRVVGAPPTISDIPNQSFLEDCATPTGCTTGPTAGPLTIGPLPFTIGASGVDPNLLTVSGSSSDTTVIPNSALVFGGSGASRTLTINLPRDAYNALDASVGNPTVITVTVANGDVTASDTFSVRLREVNDPPNFDVREVTLPVGTASGINQQNAVVTNTSVGPANEATPPTGSGVPAQIIDAASTIVEVLAQSPTPIITGTPTISLAAGGRLTMQLVNGGGGTVPVGAACLRVTIFDTGDIVPPGENFRARTFKVRVGSADISCPP